MSNDHDFVKIVADLPEGDLGVYGEGLWTKPLGHDLYEVQNSPWHCREINFLDVVKAIAPSEDKHPVFTSVERRSGHRTMQIILLEKGKANKDDILARLNELGATYENANGSLFALDYAPGIEWEAAKTYLDDLAVKEWLEYRWSAY
jgi:hypothetical protein